MTEDYPTPLLPTLEDKIVQLKDILPSLNFVRRARDVGTITDSSGTRIKLEAVVDGTKRHQLTTLSLNILGEYQVSYLLLECQENSSYYYGDWLPGAEVAIPNRDHFVELDPTKAQPIFFCFEGEIDIPYDVDIGDHMGEINIRHCPTNCNFWHCQVSLFDEEKQKYLEGSTDKGWYRLILDTLAIAMIEYWASPTRQVDRDIELPRQLRAQSRVS